MTVLGSLFGFVLLAGAAGLLAARFPRLRWHPPVVRWLPWWIATVFVLGVLWPGGAVVVAVLTGGPTEVYLALLTGIVVQLACETWLRGRDLEWFVGSSFTVARLLQIAVLSSVLVRPDPVLLGAAALWAVNLVVLVRLRRAPGVERIAM